MEEECLSKNKNQKHKKQKQHLIARCLNAQICFYYLQECAYKLMLNVDSLHLFQVKVLNELPSSEICAIINTKASCQY